MSWRAAQNFSAPAAGQSVFRVTLVFSPGAQWRARFVARCEYFFSAPAAGQPMFRGILDFYFVVGRTMACSLRDTLWRFFWRLRGGQTVFRVTSGFLPGARWPVRFVTRCAQFFGACGGPIYFSRDLRCWPSARCPACFVTGCTRFFGACSGPSYVCLRFLFLVHLYILATP